MASEDEMPGWHHRCNGHELGKLWEMVRDREAWRATVHGITKSRTRLGERIATTSIPSFVLFCFVFTYLETKVL